MKAILVMEMPQSCDKCPLFSGHYSDMTCRGNHRTINYPYPDNKVQDWCPLVPKRDMDGVGGDCNAEEKAGWNACLEMSNDLISRSALLKEMEDYCGEQRYLISENVWDMVKNLPVAYDADKVVEQLEEMKSNAVKNIELNSQGYDLESEMEWEKKHYDKIIGLVKAGGVNE